MRWKCKPLITHSLWIPLIDSFSEVWLEWLYYVLFLQLSVGVGNLIMQPAEFDIPQS